MSPETRYRIEELEQLTGLSRRLIYDYISRELVPAAMGSGKGAYYLQEHYDRLRLISLLRAAGFRLERIEEALKSWEPDEIARIVDLAEGRDVESLEALNEWLSQPRTASFEPVESTMQFLRQDTSQDLFDDLALAGDQDFPRDQDFPTHQDLPMDQDLPPGAAIPMRYSSARAASPPSSGPSWRRTQKWERFDVSPDVEINYRQRRDPDLQRRVAELLEFAEALFREPAPTQDVPNDGDE